MKSEFKFFCIVSLIIYLAKATIIDNSITTIKNDKNISQIDKNKTISLNNTITTDKPSDIKFPSKIRKLRRWKHARRKRRGSQFGFIGYTTYIRFSHKRPQKEEPGEDEANINPQDCDCNKNKNQDDEDEYYYYDTESEQDVTRFKDERTEFLENTLHCVDIATLTKDTKNVPKCLLNNLDNNFEKSIACESILDDILYNFDHRLIVREVKTDDVDDNIILHLEKLLMLGDTAEFSGVLKQQCFFKMNEKNNLKLIYPVRVPYMTFSDALHDMTEFQLMSLPECKMATASIQNSIVWKFVVIKNIIEAAFNLLSNCLYIDEFDNNDIEFLDQNIARFSPKSQYKHYCEPKRSLWTKNVYADVFLLTEGIVKQPSKVIIKEGNYEEASMFKVKILEKMKEFFDSNPDHGIADTFTNIVADCNEELDRVYEQNPMMFNDIYPFQPFNFNIGAVSAQLLKVDIINKPLNYKCTKDLLFLSENEGFFMLLTNSL